MDSPGNSVKRVKERGKKKGGWEVHPSGTEQEGAVHGSIYSHLASSRNV